MKEPRSGKESKHPRQPVRLKQLAAHLSLDPATVSVVLNDVPCRSIPQSTRDRSKAAARKLNYHPNLLARSLRSCQSKTIGILVPELGDGYHTQVMSGIGDCLINAGYFYFTLHHRHRPELIEDYTQMFIARGGRASSPSIRCSRIPFPFRWLRSPAIVACNESPTSLWITVAPQC